MHFLEKIKISINAPSEYVSVLIVLGLTLNCVFTFKWQMMLELRYLEQEPCILNTTA